VETHPNYQASKNNERFKMAWWDKPAGPYLLVVAIALSLFTLPGGRLYGRDWRNIQSGYEIPSENYVDQPYVVVTRDGNWLCTLTTGAGREGEIGQHIVASISRDKGKTWSKLIDIEPANGPEASWAMPLVTTSGRVYVFYDYNGDRIRTLPDGRRARADMLGWYCYKYSDDSGKTWSERHRLPVRVTACDRTNDWQGQVQILWGIGKPVVSGDSVFFAFTKLGKYMLDNGEGWFFRSDNILTEPDVSKIVWQMLPDGDYGLRAPRFGSVQEEHNLVVLDNGDLYCMYRTTTGHPAHSYSRDGGHTWSTPEIATYAPGRNHVKDHFPQKFKHPRACPRIWRTSNGRFLFWFHNHAGKDFKGRNPAWISGGVEKNGFIYWSQPEILLYDPDPEVRISYPDLIEQDCRFWVTETQKETARVHEIDCTLLEGLWQQRQIRTVASDGLVLSVDAANLQPGTEVVMPRLARLSKGGGFSIELWLTVADLKAGQVVLDCRDQTGTGIVVTTADAGRLQLEISDGKEKVNCRCDQGLLTVNTLHHIVFIVDGGPKIISVLFDGLLCDGGTHGQYGWARFDRQISDVNRAAKLKVAPSFAGELKSLRVYNRYLRTSEAVGNFQAGPSPTSSKHEALNPKPMMVIG
jgi:hypothetical protein